MSQATRVLQLSPAQAARLEQALAERLPADAEWRRVAHARFSVKALGVVLTCYHSGKLVAQGADPDTFLARFGEDIAPGQPASGASATDDMQLGALTVASDEAGKGDYFGPLVVAAVFAGPADADRLATIGVTDSKNVRDPRVRRMAGLVEAAFDHAVVSLEPEAYNHEHARVGNLNSMLAELHAAALSQVLARHPETDLVLVDKFADDSLLAEALARRGPLPPRLLQVPRAEQHPAAAAASVLARAAFLDGLDRCSDACGADLHKGAGAPVDAAASRVVRIGGRQLLAKVAKLHFKNTDKLARRDGDSR